MSESQTVFIGVMADWCLTSKANKTLVLDREPITDHLIDDTVIAIHADWTRPNDEMSHFLKQPRRYHISFNIVFGQGALPDIALPDPLTERTVLKALETALQAIEPERGIWKADHSFARRLPDQRSRDKSLRIGQSGR